VLSEAFIDSAIAHFDFLVKEHGFVGPLVDRNSVSFSTNRFVIEILYDWRDGRVITKVKADVGNRHPRASLDCLYVEAKLGPAQQIKDIARSTHSLVKALGSQASALVELMPILNGPWGSSLLLRCHGR
jgi:hypothetical protein